MATSGSKTVAVTSWNTLEFSWSESSQSVASNSTTIKWAMKLIAGSSGRISSTASKDWSVTVNGNKYSGTNTIGVSANATKTLASGSTVIPHNADGTKTFSYSFSQEFGITFSGSSIGTISGSGSGTLDTIARATTPTLSASSVDMGGSVTINMPRASSGFTHDLAYSFAGSAYSSITTGAGTSYSWTVPDLASKIPNATSGTVTIRCITKSGSTTVGTKTVNLTAKVPTSVVPVISSVAVSEATSGLAAQFGAYIQGKSKLAVQVNAAGAKGSTIKSYRTTLQGNTYTTASFTSSLLSSAGSLSLVTTVTDSRGRTAKKTTTITVLAYTPPKIQKLAAYRYDAEGDPDEVGEYIGVDYAYSVTALGDKNTAAMTVAYKRSTEADSEYTTLLTASSLSANTTAKPTTPTFSADYSYTVRMTVTDWFGATASTTTQLPTGAVILDIGADGESLGLFKVAERKGVDFGKSAKGAVLGLWEATVEIPENGNFDDYLQPGVYGVPSNAVMLTLSNRPCDRGGTLRVWSGLGAEKISGAYAYVVQEFHSYHNEEPVYRRHVMSDGAGVFSPGPWRAITFRGQKVLWSGGKYMTADHTVELSEPVSQQNSGIVLVFSTYSNGAPIDANFNHFFVPKKFVEIMGGYGSAFQMNTVNFSTVAAKYLYIHDTYIKGNDNNSLTGTAAGITFNNAAYVLRYVLGI